MATLSCKRNDLAMLLVGVVHDQNERVWKSDWGREGDGIVSLYFE
jgi:hypothetical protein